jgi:hypothetical protein
MGCLTPVFPQPARPVRALSERLGSLAECSNASGELRSEFTQGTILLTFAFMNSFIVADHQLPPPPPAFPP